MDFHLHACQGTAVSNSHFRKGPLRKNEIGCLGASPKRIVIEAEGMVLGQVHCHMDGSILVMAEGKLGFSNAGGIYRQEEILDH